MHPVTSERLPPPADAGRDLAAWPSAVGLLALVVLARLVYMVWLSPVELAGDEAYYWEQSRHLDWCYDEKGPALAWLVAAVLPLLRRHRVGRPPADAGLVRPGGVGRRAPGGQRLARRRCARLLRRRLSSSSPRSRPTRRSARRTGRSRPSGWRSPRSGCGCSAAGTTAAPPGGLAAPLGHARHRGAVQALGRPVPSRHRVVLVDPAAHAAPLRRFLHRPVRRRRTVRPGHLADDRVEPPARLADARAHPRPRRLRRRPDGTSTRATPRRGCSWWSAASPARSARRRSCSCSGPAAARHGSGARRRGAGATGCG